MTEASQESSCGLVISELRTYNFQTPTGEEYSLQSLGLYCPRLGCPLRLGVVVPFIGYRAPTKEKLWELMKEDIKTPDTPVHNLVQKTKFTICPGIQEIIRKAR